METDIVEVVNEVVNKVKTGRGSKTIGKPIKATIAAHTPEANKKKGSRHRARNIKIAKARVAGKTLAEIGGGFGLKPISVQKVLERDEVKALIEKQYLKLAAMLPEVTDRIIKVSQKLDDSDIEREDKSMSWEANKLIAQSHGLLPSANQSVVHQTFIGQQNNVVVPPIIAELMAKHFGGIIDIKEENSRD